MSEMWRTSSSLSSSPLSVSSCSSSTERSKWSSMACLPRPVTIRMSSIPAPTASSMTYWMEGLSTRGSISLGCALVAGRKRVPSPAAGITALRTFTMAIPPNSLIRRRFYSTLAALPPAWPGRGQWQQPRPAVTTRSRPWSLASYGHGQPDAAVGPLGAERCPVGGQAELLGRGQAALQAGLGQDEHELLAAVAGEGVDVADAAGDPAGELDQDPAAALVAEAVVDRLEVVDVKHEQGQDPAEAPGPLDLLLEAAREVAVVPGPGERVGDRQLLGLGVNAYVLDGHRR